MVISPSAVNRPAAEKVRPSSSLTAERSAATGPAPVSRSRWFPSRKVEASSTLPNLKGRTILVVDDDRDALELLHMILESCGATVQAASTTMHARGYLLASTPDLIVCDLALPREDGPAFMRSVRASANPALGRVPAVAVTAFYEDYPPTLALEFAAYFQNRRVLPEADRHRRAHPHDRRAAPAATGVSRTASSPASRCFGGLQGRVISLPSPWPIYDDSSTRSRWARRTSRLAAR
jgi:CheY-like chemotaxis protein